MSIGNFKKQIFQRFGKIRSFKEAEKIFFIDLIEEAKKEFLQWFDSNKLPEELDDLGDYMADNCEEIKEWFEKWFGK